MTIVTTYLQRVLDRIQGSGLRRLKRRSLLVNLYRCKRVLERVVDQTYQLYFQNLIWRLIVTGLFAVVNISKARVPGSSSSCDVYVATADLLIGYIAFAFMIASSIYLGMLITNLNEHFKIANDPFGTVTQLRNRAKMHVTPENDLEFDLEIVTRLALRIQQKRDDRLQAAKDNWSDQEIQRHKERMTLGKQHITWG